MHQRINLSSHIIQLQPTSVCIEKIVNVRFILRSHGDQLHDNKPFGTGDADFASHNFSLNRTIDHMLIRRKRGTQQVHQYMLILDDCHPFIPKLTNRAGDFQAELMIL